MAAAGAPFISTMIETDFCMLGGRASEAAAETVSSCADSGNANATAIAIQDETANENRAIEKPRDANEAG